MPGELSCVDGDTSGLVREPSDPIRGVEFAAVQVYGLPLMGPVLGTPTLYGSPPSSCSEVGRMEVWASSPVQCDAVDPAVGYRTRRL